MYSSIYTMASVPQAKDGDSSNIRNQIKTEIRRRVQWLSNDCSTFWRVRLEKTEWYDDNKTDDNKTSDNGLGAGNLVMALAMLSACNFLAKAYSLLVKPDAFVTEEDTAKVKGAVSKVIEAFPDFKHLLTNSKTGWRPQPKGSCNETDAFVRLIQALHNDDINLGLPSDQANTVWNSFRNKLAHMVHPKGVVEVSFKTHEKPCPDAREAVKSGGLAFRLETEGWVCNADRLSLDVLDIAEWLFSKLDECVEEKRVAALAEWMFEDADLPAAEPSQAVG